MMKNIALLLLLLVVTALPKEATADNIAEVVRHTIRGIVVDEDQKPIAAASVRLVNTTLASGTNAKGEFVLQVKQRPKYTLVVQALGYTSKTIDLEGTKDTLLKVVLELTTGRLNEVVVTGSRIEKPLKDVPIITRVIGKDEIAAVNPIDVNSLLEYTLPGIQFFYNSMSQTQEISYQGMDSKSVLFLVDGERLSGEGADHNIDFNRLNVDNIERVEIVRGAASTLYDSRAIGGVINIITKRAERPMNANFTARYAGVNGQKYGAEFGCRSERFSSFTTLGFRHRSTYKIKDGEGKRVDIINPDGTTDTRELPPSQAAIYGYRIWDASQRFNYAFTEHLSAQLSGSYYGNRRPPKSGRKFYDKYEDWVIGSKIKYIFDDNHTLDFNYSFDNYTKRAVYFQAGRSVRSYGNVNSVGRLNYTGNYGAHTLSFGGEWQYERLKHYMMKDTGTVSGSHYAAYLQEDWRITPQLNIVAGVRGDKAFQYKFHLTPKISVLYRPSANLTLRGGYARGYRVPTLKELYQEFNMAGILMLYGNKNLKPEKSQQYSLSAEYNKGGLNLTVSAYHNRFKNKISYEYLEPGVSYDMHYVNAENVKTTGIEATADYRLPWGLKVTTAYAYVNNYEKVNGYNASWVRPHSAKLNLQYKHSFHKVQGTVAFNSQWASRITRYSYDAKLKGYRQYVFDARAICSLNLGVQFLRGVKLGLMVDNLFNYKDKAADSTVQAPLNGVSYVATLALNISDLVKF